MQWMDFLECFILYKFCYFSMFCTSTLIWNSPYFNFFCHSIWNARMSSARALTRQTFLVLPEYCSFSKVVLQYQYQGSSIVLQYKTARLVHPWWTEQLKNVNKFYCSCLYHWEILHYCAILGFFWITLYFTPNQFPTS